MKLKLLVLTGAGISAESGIPTFRGEEGYWVVGSRHYHPQEMATSSAFRSMGPEVWAWYLYRRTVCRQADPNPAHTLLSRFEEELGDGFLLVTQNVDGLHRRAGNSPERTYEIHGNIDYGRCWEECSSERFPIGDELLPFEKGRSLTAAEWETLRCPRCGGRARPHVLWFDECYDEERYRFQSSRHAASRAEVLVSVGTSGSTNLPMQMGYLASTRGAQLIDINLESNPFSQLALQHGGKWLRGSASEGLAKVAEMLKI